MIIFNYQATEWETRVTALYECWSVLETSRVGKIGYVVACFVDLGSLALQNIFVFQPVISNLTISLNNNRLLGELKSLFSSLKITLPKSDGIVYVQTTHLKWNYTCAWSFLYNGVQIMPFLPSQDPSFFNRVWVPYLFNMTTWLP